MIRRQQRAVNRLFTSLLLVPACHLSALTVIDDMGNGIDIDRPVQRIISLAPHATELVFAAGAGDKLVGAVRYSNYPQAATAIPRVGDTHNLDIERIVALDPDLVIGWYSGNGPGNLENLQRLRYPVYISEPESLRTIAKTIRDLGVLAGTKNTANYNSDQFLLALSRLSDNYANRPVIRVFYQIWHQPIFTVNGKHIISEVIRLCGGQNIFSDLPALSPQVSLEAVLNADPDIIIASGTDANRPAWLDKWLEWPSLRAVANKQIYFIPPDLIQRQTPRILQGATSLCEYLDRARNNNGE